MTVAYLFSENQWTVLVLQRNPNYSILEGGGATLLIPIRNLTLKLTLKLIFQDLNQGTPPVPFKKRTCSLLNLPLLFTGLVFCESTALWRMISLEHQLELSTILSFL